MRTLLSLAACIAAASASAADRIVILQPSSTTVNVAGQENGTVTPIEAAKRVIPKFLGEATGKLKWDEFEWVGFDQSLKAQGEAMGVANVDGKTISVRELQTVADKLEARYVVTFTIRELTGYRAQGLVPRKGGRASVGVLVYDAKDKKYVWQADKTETSIREQWFDGEGLRAMQDQALFNALRKALEPFVKDGARKEIETPSQGLIAKTASVVDAKQILLDLSQASGLKKGDELVSLDGKCRIRVTEVLANGSLAEVLEGEPKEGMIFRTP